MIRPAAFFLLFAALCAATQADTITISAAPGEFLSEDFRAVETWTVLGGTGGGLIFVLGAPPFISGEAIVAPGDQKNDAVAAVFFEAFGVNYQSLGPPPTGSGAAFRFAFGVPFTFNSPVELFAAGGLGTAVASADYDTSPGTYLIPSESDAQAGDPFGFQCDDDPDLPFVTLERSAVFLPEPNLIWACLAGLVAIGVRKREF